MLKLSKLKCACTIAVLACAGCATRALFVQAQGLTPDETAMVIVYRPKTAYQALNPERPFLFIEDKEVGKLAIGTSIRVTLKPGEYRLAMRESILFQPAYEIRSLSLTVRAGETHYVRYAREIEDIVRVPDRFDVVPPSIGKTAR